MQSTNTWCPLRSAWYLSQEWGIWGMLYMMRLNGWRNTTSKFLGLLGGRHAATSYSADPTRMKFGIAGWEECRHTLTRRTLGVIRRVVSLCGLFAPHVFLSLGQMGLLTWLKLNQTYCDPKQFESSDFWFDSVWVRRNFGQTQMESNRKLIWPKPNQIAKTAGPNWVKVKFCSIQAKPRRNSIWLKLRQ